MDIKIEPLIEIGLIVAQQDVVAHPLLHIPILQFDTQLVMPGNLVVQFVMDFGDNLYGQILDLQ